MSWAVSSELNWEVKEDLEADGSVEADSEADSEAAYLEGPGLEALDLMGDGWEAVYLVEADDSVVADDLEANSKEVDLLAVGKTILL